MPCSQHDTVSPVAQSWPCPPPAAAMTERARAALAKWADYPVERAPRPIVLTGYTPQTADRSAKDPRRLSVSATARRTR